jgi:putative tryptophan/tyrosine transport system substrate-binding protein
MVTASQFGGNHIAAIVEVAARHSLPAVDSFRYFAGAGGLISCGFDVSDEHRCAAGYVDRILKGEKPDDLPVQAPTKYQLVINVNSAKTLSLEVSPMLLVRADEIID